MLVDCDLCGKPVNTKRAGTCRYVEGWEKNRSQGGTNAIAMRKVHDRWAHDACVALKAKGLLHQEAML